VRVTRWAHVVVPLVLGALVYVAWRSTEVTLVGWFPSSIVTVLRAFAARVPLPALVVGTAPDVAWGWSFGAMMGIVWNGRPSSRRKVGWICAGALVAAYAEVGQLWQLPPGRFDVVDLLGIVVGYAIGVAITSRATSPRSTPSPRPLPRDRDQSEIPCTRG
jgi:hypothetical protein